MKNKYIVTVMSDVAASETGDALKLSRDFNVCQYSIEDGVLKLVPSDEDGYVREKIFIPLCKIYEISVKHIDGTAV